MGSGGTGIHRFPQPCWALDTAPLLAEWTGEISPARQSRGSSPVEPAAIAIHYWFLEVSWRSSAQSLIFYQSQLIFRVTLEFYLSDLDFFALSKPNRACSISISGISFWRKKLSLQGRNPTWRLVSQPQMLQIWEVAHFLHQIPTDFIWRLTYPSENMKVNGKDYPIYYGK